MATEPGMIEPFVETQKRDGVISYGLSIYGYDARVRRRIQDFHQCRLRHRRPESTSTRPASSTAPAPVCIIPPNSFALAHTVEYFRIPRDVLVICLGKSTYARCGIIVNVTPLEPEWEGQVTHRDLQHHAAAGQNLRRRGHLPVPVPAGRQRLRDQLCRQSGQIYGPARRRVAAALQDVSHGLDSHPRRRAARRRHPHLRRQERRPAADGRRPAHRRASGAHQCREAGRSRHHGRSCWRSMASPWSRRTAALCPSAAASPTPRRPTTSSARCAPRFWCSARCWPAAAKPASRCPAAAPSAPARSTCT